MFLSERHVLFAHRVQDGGYPELVLTVIDFKSAPSERTIILKLAHTCKMTFPRLKDACDVLAISLRSDPSPGWKPHRDLAVPFHRDRCERLFVLTAWFSERQLLKPLLFFIPSSTVLRHVERCESDTTLRGQTIPWDDWGPSGVRLWPAPRRPPHMWVCFVYGMSFVGVMRRRDLSKIQVFDFNQLAVRKRLSETMAEGNESLADVVVQSSRNKGVFQGEGSVITSLPFLRRTFRAPSSLMGREEPTIMLSEDSLIMMNNVSPLYALSEVPMIDVTMYQSEGIQQYRVFNF